MPEAMVRVVLFKGNSRGSPIWLLPTPFSAIVPLPPSVWLFENCTPVGDVGALTVTVELTVRLSKLVTSVLLSKLASTSSVTFLHVLVPRDYVERAAAARRRLEGACC